MAKTQQADNSREPEGHLLAGGISFSKLSPLAGALARKGTPTLCGWITGLVMATVREPGNDYGAYTRFVGDFFAVKHPTREEVNATELYLPRMAERFLEAAYNSHGPGCPVRFEVWAVPMPEDTPPARMGVGFHYQVYLRQPPGTLSAARRLAIESGIIAAPPAPPAQALPGPENAGTYDPATGEVLSDAAE